MKITLIICFLTIKSSYLENNEVPTDDVGDTIQWVISDQNVWRIKTYSLDEDVHPHMLPAQDFSEAEWIDLAESSNAKNYGDVIEKTLILISSSGPEGLSKQLSNNGIGGKMNVGPNGLMFWSPEGTSYRSKSQPDQ